MTNVFLRFLFIFVFLTGVMWIFDKIKSFRNKKTVYNTTIDSQKSKNNISPTKNVCILKYLGTFFPILIFVFFIRCFLYEPFYIPSNSMMPTLLPGDYIIVKKFFYQMNNPLENKKIVTYEHPKRGNIIVFTHPDHKNINYIKRIIGIPGDKVIYDSMNKTVTIYKNYKNMEDNNKKIFVDYYMFQQEDKKSHINQNNKCFKNINHQKNQSNSNNTVYKEYFNNYKYNVLVSHQQKNFSKFYFHQPFQPQQTWIIPEKQYFVMGDNRDDSLDSRYWGFVPEKNIIGIAKYIWMSLEKQENQWPTGINLHRIGKIN